MMQQRIRWRLLFRLVADELGGLFWQATSLPNPVVL